MNNMAQSKRHAYNRVSGLNQCGMALGGLLEQAWTPVDITCVGAGETGWPSAEALDFQEAFGALVLGGWTGPPSPELDPNWGPLGLTSDSSWS